MRCFQGQSPKPLHGDMSSFLRSANLYPGELASNCGTVKTEVENEHLTQQQGFSTNRSDHMLQKTGQNAKPTEHAATDKSKLRVQNWAFTTWRGYLLERILFTFVFCFVLLGAPQSFVARATEGLSRVNGNTLLWRQSLEIVCALCWAQRTKITRTRIPRCAAACPSASAVLFMWWVCLNPVARFRPSLLVSLWLPSSLRSGPPGHCFHGLWLAALNGCSLGVTTSNVSRNP